MNKIFKISIITALSGFLLVGCSTSPDAPDTSSSQISSVEAHAAKIHGNLSQKKLSKIVQEAGEKAGWKMTPFKSNAFIAEKTDGDETESTTVEFDQESIEISPENSDLEDAINKAFGR